MAKEFQCLPSQILNTQDDYAAYCLNESCFIWGVYVENELHKASRDSKDKKQNKEQETFMRKRKQRMASIMETDNKAHPAPAKRFKDPAELFTKK